MTPPDYSVAEAAQMLGFSTQTIRRWINSGHLPAFKPVDTPQSQWRIPRAAIDAMRDSARTKR